MKNQPAQNKMQILKALIEFTGDDFNTFLCGVGTDATEMRRQDYPEPIIERNIEVAIDNKIADLIDELQPIPAQEEGMAIENHEFGDREWSVNQCYEGSVELYSEYKDGRGDPFRDEDGTEIVSTICINEGDVRALASHFNIKLAA